MAGSQDQSRRQVADTRNHNCIHLWPAAPFLGTHFQIAASGVGTGAKPAVDNTSTLELAWVSDKSHSLSCSDKEPGLSLCAHEVCCGNTPDRKRGKSSLLDTQARSSLSSAWEKRPTYAAEHGASRGAVTGERGDFGMKPSNDIVAVNVALW